MNLKIPYGATSINVNIPEPCIVLQPPKLTIPDEKKIFEQALNHPIHSISLQDFLKQADELLVIVNDRMRPTPTATSLKYLHPFFEKYKSTITFIVACGSHRQPTDEELHEIFGTCYGQYKDSIVIHQAKDDKTLEYIGTTTRGTKVSINKLVNKIKNVFIIGSIEPHYFAGFTGGRKAILPGVSSYETIEMNHKHALNENARPLALDGNPVHEDMVEAVNLLQDVNMFSLQMILTGNDELYAVTAGDIHRSFYQAVQNAKQVYTVPIQEQTPLVITIPSPPLDVNLYQSQKAIEHGKLALSPDGVLILVSSCHGGTGNRAFLDALCSAETPELVMSAIGEEYKLGYHKAAKLAHLQTHSKLWVVSDLPDDVIRNAHMTPYHDLQQAVDDAKILLKKQGQSLKTTVLYAGSCIVPRFTEQKIK